MTKFRALFAALLVPAIAAVPTLSTDAVAAKKPAAKALKVESGKTTLAFDTAFVQKVIGLGVLPAPIAPATTGSEITEFVFPVGGGKVDAKGRNATIKHKGGQRLEQQSTGTVRTLTNLSARIKGKNITVLGDAGTDSGVLLTGVPFLKGTGTAKKTNKSFTYTSSRLVLTEEAASDLNSQFGGGRQVFAAGEVVGSGKITAKK